MPRKKSSPMVSSFLAQLPEPRRREVERVRDVVRRNLPAGYEEAASGNLLVYQVPLQRYPDTYNGQPLCYVGLATQRNHLSLYLMRVYADAVQQQRLKTAFKAAGKRLDMGKACIRFKTADDLPLEAVGQNRGEHSGRTVGGDRRIRPPALRQPVSGRILLILSMLLLATGIWILTGACAFAMSSVPPEDQVAAYRAAFYQRALFGVGCLMGAIVLLRVRRGRQTPDGEAQPPQPPPA